MDINIVYFLVACFLGLLMTWGVGANDLANIMSTTMGSKSITVKQAMVIAIVFEFAGAFFGGSDVTKTVSGGIINLIQFDSHQIIVGMLSILLASASWMLLASYLGMPVSITNAIVGSLVGFGVAVAGWNGIHWNKVGQIAISWVSSPTLAGVVGYIFFTIISRSIFSHPTPLRAAKKWVPVYLFLIGLVLSEIIVHKGLLHFQARLGDFSWLLSPPMVVMSAVVVGFLVVGLGLLIIRRITFIPYNLHSQFIYIEKMFGVLMGFTACAMVFAHGSNDVAIAVGPIDALLKKITLPGNMAFLQNSSVAWVTFLGCVGVIVGLMMYGRKVIATVGEGITSLTPSRAVAATLAAASTVLVSTSAGIPVSATQTLVGAVLGVGFARGIGALNLKVIRNIFMSWVLTVPAGAGLSILFYYTFRSVF